MKVSDAPYCPSLLSSAKLRIAATKLQNSFATAWARSQSFRLPEQLMKFWQDQKARIANPTGTPYDGLFLGPGVDDTRPLCYRVLSELRLNRTAEKVAELEAFFDYFIMAAWSLDTARTQVASLVVKPLYDNPGFFSGPPNAIMRFEVTFLDAAGHLVPISADHPALGTVDIMYSAEGHKDFVGKYRGFFLKPTSNPWVMDRGTVNDSSHEGANTVTVKYTADIEPAIEQPCPYQRGVAASGAAPAKKTVKKAPVESAE